MPKGSSKEKAESAAISGRAGSSPSLAETLVSPPAAIPASPSVPDHQLLRCVGRGAYGEVWLARNVMGTWRAAKIIYRGRFRQAEPFEREFSGLKRFEPISRTHPGFVSVLHIGRNDIEGFFYYIMEVADDAASGQTFEPLQYVPRTLGRELSRRGRLPKEEALQIGIALADALRHLHQHGLIHRDIKPSNIIFVNDTPKFADIGLVTEIGEAASYGGTEGYIPPEGPGTAAGEIYSLGKVLYEVVTGHRPEQYPELPSDFPAGREGLQMTRLNNVILKACETDPPKRFQSAQELLAALAECQHANKLAQPGSEQKTTGTPPASRMPAGRIENERRKVTLLFTEICFLNEVDPELVHDLVEPGLAVIRQEIQRFEGTVAQTLNCGVMALFGAPIAHEDHAQRAVHAALAVQRAFTDRAAELKGTGGIESHVRSALNTGLVLAGTSHESKAYTATGAAVNLGAQTLSLIEPGQIVISDETWKAVDGYFETSSLGQRRLPGHSNPLTLHRVVGIREARTRIEVGSQKGLTPYVGRGRELEVLQDRMAQARAGRGQVALVTGEAGAGKSRLLLEFRRAIEKDPLTWLTGRSLSYGKQLAYLPVIELLKQLFEIGPTDDETAIVRKVETNVAPLGAEFHFATPILLGLLSVRPDQSPVFEMDARQRRIKTFEALRAAFFRAAQNRPLVLVVEDLHWIDKASEDFLVYLADSVPRARVLLLANYRPGYQNPFPERSYITRAALRPLSEEDSIRLAEGMLAAPDFPIELRQLVTERAEGNPFFLEELIRSLLETGVLRSENGRYVAGKALAEVRVPDTLQDVIMGRIDRLPSSAKKALQLASIIGREFNVRLLETLAEWDKPLDESLQQLKDAELVYERSFFPEVSYLFKHALTQDVAYNSLPIQRRKELHRFLAAAIEELYADRLPEFYGVLAHHYERGEEWERALDYLLRAAESARRVRAHREQAGLLARAIQVAQRGPQKDQIGRLRAERGRAFTDIALWAEARPELEASLASLGPGDLEIRAEALASLTWASIWLSDLPGSLRYANEALAAAEQAKRDDLAAHAMGSLAMMQTVSSPQPKPHYAQARELFLRAIQRAGGMNVESLSYAAHASYSLGKYDEGVRLAQDAVRGFQTRNMSTGTLLAMSHLGLNLAAQGRYGEADHAFDEARRFGRQYEIWPLLARCISMSSAHHLDLFDYSGAETLDEEARELARSTGFPPAIMSSEIDLLFNWTRRGDVGRAAGRVDQVTKEATGVPSMHQEIWAVRLVQARAEIELEQRNYEAALSLARQGLTHCSITGRVKYQVLALWTCARALHASGRTAEAITQLRAALDLARKIDQPALILQVGTSLLEMAGDDALQTELLATAQRILAALPEGSLRRSFLAAQPLRGLGL